MLLLALFLIKASVFLIAIFQKSIPTYPRPLVVDKKEKSPYLPKKKGADNIANAPFILSYFNQAPSMWSLYLLEPQLPPSGSV